MAKSPDPKMALNYDFKIIEWIKSKLNFQLFQKGSCMLMILKTFRFRRRRNLASNHGGRMVNSGISVLEILRDHKNNSIKIFSILLMVV